MQDYTYNNAHEELSYQLFIARHALGEAIEAMADALDVVENHEEDFKLVDKLEVKSLLQMLDAAATQLKLGTINGLGRS